MKPSYAAIAAIVALVSSARGDDSWAWSWSGYVFGKGFHTETDVDQKDFAASPAWEKNADTPPLSARKALELGDKLAGEQVKEPPGWRRELECLSLVPMEKKWAWQPKYLWRSPKGGTNNGRSVPFVVFMNGKVATPRVTDESNPAADPDTEASVMEIHRLRWYGHTGAKKYIYRISSDAVNRSPAWLAGSPDPPLSARTALKRANEFADRALIGRPEARRELSSLDLTPTGRKDKWLWIAVYEWWPNRGGTGPVPKAYAIILMDETVIAPEIIDDPECRLLGIDD